MALIFNVYVDKAFVDELDLKITEARRNPKMNYDKQNVFENFYYNFLCDLVNANIFTNIKVSDLCDDTKPYKYMLNRGNVFPLEVPDLFDNIFNYANKLNVTGFTIFLCGSNIASENSIKHENHLFMCCNDLLVKWNKIRDLSLRQFVLDSKPLDRWNFLDGIDEPLNTIVIVDPFLKKDLKTLNNNLKILLNKLLINFDRNSRLDLAMFFEKDLVGTRNGGNYLSCEDFSNWVIDCLSLENVLYFNLIFIDSKNLASQGIKKEHNRFIITNYWEIISGRSFDFLNSDGHFYGSSDRLSVSFVFDQLSTVALAYNIKRLHRRFVQNIQSSDLIKGDFFNRVVSTLK